MQSIVDNPDLRWPAEMRDYGAEVLGSEDLDLLFEGLICGTKVDYLRGVNRSGPNGYFPEASLLSWRPFFPMEGTVSVRMVGVGYNRVAWNRGGGEAAVTGRCEGTITFRYRCRWADNGRAVVLETTLVEGPTVVRGR